MKVIKKYFKVVLCFMAFAVCSFLLAFAPTMSAYASLNYVKANYNLAINSIKMPKVVDAETEGLKIPLLKGFFGENSDSVSQEIYYIVRVIDPSGYSHDFQVGGLNKSSDSAYFTLNKAEGYVQVNALTDGDYKIVYIVKNVEILNASTPEETEKVLSTYYSNTYKVEVKNVSYELDFSVQTGDKAGWVNLLPQEVKTNAEGKIYIPKAFAKVVGGEKTFELSQANGEITVSRNGAIQKLNESDFKSDAEGFYIVPSQSGIYKVQYTFKSGVNRPTKTLTIKVTDDFVEPTELKVTTTPSLPSKFELGEKDITLPKLVAKNELSDNVEYNTVSIRIQHETKANIYQELKNNDYSFNMTVGADGFANATSYSDLVGIYTITYTLEDAYGNRVEKEYRMEQSSTASKKPTIYMSYDYDTTKLDEVDTDATSELKSKYGYDEIILPAAYAEDLVSDYEDLTIVRYLRNINSSTIYYVDNLKYNSATGELEAVEEGSIGYNYADDKTTNPGLGNVNKSVQFKFADTAEKAKTYDGTYQLEYRVIAKNITTREQTLVETGTTRYSFAVLDYPMSEYKATTPSVEITNIQKGLTVDKAKDLTVTVKATDEDDTRLKNVVFYYYGDEKADHDTIAGNIKNVIASVQADKDNTKHVLDQEKVLTLLKDATTYNYNGIELAKMNEDKNGYVVNFDNAEGNKAVIIAVSYNDYGNVAVDTKVVNFKDTSETVAPVATIIDAKGLANGSDVHNYTTLNNVKSGADVELPIVEFEDSDKNLELNVMYYINSPETENGGVQYRSPYGKVYAGNRITGGKIKASAAGVYYVAYTATDDAGNTSVMYFTFEVVDTTKPILDVSITGENLETTGNTIKSVVGSTLNFGTNVYVGEDADVNVTEEATVTVAVDDNGKELDYGPSGDKLNSYKFNSVGDYTITITAKYDNREAVTKVYYLTIKELELKWTQEFEIQEYANVNEYVYLPDIAATYNAEVKVKVVAPNDTKIEDLDRDGYLPKDVESGVSVYKFKTNSTKGRYKVTYIATLDEKVIEKTFTIIVGDNVPPTFQLSYSELEQDIVYDGENQIEYTLKVDKSNRTFVVVAKSNGKTIYEHDTGLTIYDKDDTNASATKMYWSNLTYELIGSKNIKDGEKDGEYIISGTGDFTIKLTIKDDYENESEKLIKFKVVEKTNAKESEDSTVGVVLIVLSLLILGGVIVFFLLTGKKSGNGKAKVAHKTESAKVEEKQVEEKVEVVEETEAKEGEIEE